MLALVGLAISFALPLLAQESDTVGLETRQRIEAVLKMRERAINKNDAAAVAVLYTRGATSIRLWSRKLNGKFMDSSDPFGLVFLSLW